MSLLGIVIIIYVVVGIFFGIDWLKTMFMEAGCIGKAIASIWVIALILGIVKYFY